MKIVLVGLQVLSLALNVFLWGRLSIRTGELPGQGASFRE